MANIINIQVRPERNPNQYLFSCPCCYKSVRQRIEVAVRFKLLDGGKFSQYPDTKSFVTYSHICTLCEECALEYEAVLRLHRINDATFIALLYALEGNGGSNRVIRKMAFLPKELLFTKSILFMLLTSDWNRDNFYVYVKFPASKLRSFMNYPELDFRFGQRNSMCVHTDGVKDVDSDFIATFLLRTSLRHVVDERYTVLVEGVQDEVRFGVSCSTLRIFLYTAQNVPSNAKEYFAERSFRTSFELTYADLFVLWEFSRNVDVICGDIDTPLRVLINATMWSLVWNNFVEFDKDMQFALEHINREYRVDTRPMFAVET